jgi:iron complex outermembrane recepter protein
MSSSLQRIRGPRASAPTPQWLKLAIAGILAASALPAQSAEPAAAAGDSLEEIVVTAQFRQEKLQNVPIAITALSSDAMDQRNMTNLLDVANVAPNVTMFGASAAFGKTNAAFIRGIGQGDFNLAAGEPGVGIYIDDVYFSTTLGSAFDLFDLDRVEILRGPQGTLFGKNSIGGAVNMVSKKPVGDGSGFLDVTLGDYSRRDFKAGYDMTIVPDSLFLRVSVMEQYRTGYVTRVSYGCVNPQPAAGTGAVTDSRGYAVNTNAPDYLQGNAPNTLGGGCATGTQGGIDVRGARAQLRWIINDKMENNFTAWVIDDNSEAAAETLVIANPIPFNTYLLAKYGQQFDSRFLTKNFYTTYSNFLDLDKQEQIPPVDTMHQWGFSDVFDWDLADKLHLKSITSYLGYWTDFSDDQSNSPLPIAWAYNLVDHQQYTQEFRLTGSALPNNQLDWATGAFFYHGESTNRGHINVALVGLDFDQNSPSLTQNEAIFGQVTEHLTDQLDLTLGARETKENKEYTYQSFFGRVGPYTENYRHFDYKGNIAYKFTPDVMVYASMSTGFRGGGFNPRPFAESQINEFKPERLTEFEVGAKSDWFDHRLRANVAAFYGRYKDLQLNSQQIDATGTPYTGVQNVGGAKIYGYEVELEVRPIGGLMLTASAGYTGFKYQNLGTSVGCADTEAAALAGGCVAGNPGYSDRPVSQPKLKASVGVGYEVPLPGGSKITPRVDATYQGLTYWDVINNTPGSSVGSYTLLSGRVQWDAENGKWSVAGLGTNLANKQYYVSLFDLRAFGEGMESGQPGRPREWAVNIKYKF